MQYFLDLKNTFQSDYQGPEQKKEMDRDFEKIFLSNLLDKVKQAWEDHESSKRDTHLLSESELNMIWKISQKEIVDNTLNKLSDLGYINTGVNENGDIVYSISEDGMQYLDHLKEL
jgi:hypothetical protein